MSVKRQLDNWLARHGHRTTDQAFYTLRELEFLGVPTMLALRARRELDSVGAHRQLAGFNPLDDWLGWDDASTIGAWLEETGISDVVEDTVGEALKKAWKKLQRSGRAYLDSLAGSYGIPLSDLRQRARELGVSDITEGLTDQELAVLARSAASGKTGIDQPPRYAADPQSGSFALGLDLPTLLVLGGLAWLVFGGRS